METIQSPTRGPSRRRRVCYNICSSLVGPMWRRNAVLCCCARRTPDIHVGANVSLELTELIWRPSVQYIQDVFVKNKQILTYEVQQYKVVSSGSCWFCFGIFDTSYLAYNNIFKKRKALNNRVIFVSPLQYFLHKNEFNVRIY